MDLEDAICGRRAVRHYKPDAVPEHNLRKLVRTAVWAPSAMNEQPWHFTVITRRDLLDEISAQGKIWVRENEPWLADNEELRSLLRAPHYHMLHHAPALIVISASAAGKWTAEGCAGAAQNLMLAATGQGLGSCWIGLAQDWLNSAPGRRLIELPADEKVVAPIVVGYAAEEVPAGTRRSPKVTWIGDRVFHEDGEPAEQLSIAGLFGGLVRQAS